MTIFQPGIKSYESQTFCFLISKNISVGYNVCILYVTDSKYLFDYFHSSFPETCLLIRLKQILRALFTLALFHVQSKTVRINNGINEPKYCSWSHAYNYLKISPKKNLVISYGDINMDKEQVFELGNDTLRVPRKLHTLNRQRLVAELRGKLNTKGKFVVLQGGNDIPFYSTDGVILFRQESYFHWAFGVKEPEFYGAIDTESGKSILFMPRLPEAYGVWSGKIQPPKYFKELYAVDEVFYSDEIAKVLKSKGAKTLLTLHGVNTDSSLITKEAVFDGMGQFVIENATLFPIITELRVYKTEYELEVIRYTNKISSEAHKHVMKNIKPNMMEYELESMFQDFAYRKGGCRHVAYCCIAATGDNAATLHYGHAGAPNNKKILDGDICLFDMGAEYYRYASDITCSFPVNGKFTKKQIEIYNAVLKANRAVMAACRPGVSWTKMHLLAEKVILEEMVKMGIVRGHVDAMMKERIGALFMPHGLGHFLGVDTHDVGGYPHGCHRSTEDGLKSLRTARDLKKGMVITIEPGLYFITSVLDKALKNPEKSRFLVEDVLKHYYGFGGVRIEDNIFITDFGCELMTKVPRTVEEIERHMAGISED